MVAAPYVPQVYQYSSTQPQASSTTATSGTTYSSSSPKPTAPVEQHTYSSYAAPSSSYAATSSTSAYGPPITSTSTVPTYSTRPPSNSTTNVSSSSTPYSYAPSTASNSYGQNSAQQQAKTQGRVPDFSTALDVPPPVTPSYSSSNHNTGAVVTSTTTTYPSKYDSSVYSSAPIQATQVTTASTTISEGNPTKCHKVDYEIKGNDMQLVEVELDPGETVIAEAGAMMFMENDISFKAKLGDGSNPSQGFFGKILGAAGRLLTGESLFLTHFTNEAPQGKNRVAFAAPYPGTIIPVNMGAHGEKLICQKDAFLCAAYGTKVSIHFNRRLGSGLFGGEGFILQKLKGDGMAFIHAGGTLVRRELRGEKLRVDTGCVVAFTDGIDFSVELAPGLKSILFGGEGIFLATLQGTGTVWLQSLPFSRLADRILANAPSAGGRRTGEGSNLTGGFGDLIDGDGFGRFR